MKKILLIILSFGCAFAGINNLTLATENIEIEKSNIDRQNFEKEERKLISESKICLNNLINNYLNIYKYDSKITFVFNPLGAYGIYNLEITIENDKNTSLSVIETLSSLILSYFENNYSRIKLNKSNNHLVEYPAKEVIRKWKDSNDLYMSKLNEIGSDSQQTLQEKINLLTQNSINDENIIVKNIKDDLNQLISMLSISFTNDDSIQISYDCMTCWRGICEYSKKIKNINDIKSVLDELISKVLSYYYSCNWHVDSTESTREIVCKDIIDNWKNKGIYNSKLEEISNESILNLKNKINNEFEKHKIQKYNALQNKFFMLY